MHYCQTCGMLCNCSDDDSDGLEQPPDACTHACDPEDVEEWTPIGGE